MYILIIFHYFFIDRNGKLIRTSLKIFLIISHLTQGKARKRPTQTRTTPLLRLERTKQEDHLYQKYITGLTEIAYRFILGRPNATDLKVEKKIKGGTTAWSGNIPFDRACLSTRFRLTLQRARCWLWAGQSDLKASKSPDFLISFQISFRDCSRTFPQTSPM